jgi:hypothetical protein
MSDVFHKIAQFAHGVGFVALGLKYITSPRPRFVRSHLNYRAGLHNWFHAQRRLPPRVRPLPPFYQALADRFNCRLMARHENKYRERSSWHTPTFLPAHRGSR